jgi:hypothetical protein
MTPVTGAGPGRSGRMRVPRPDRAYDVSARPAPGVARGGWPVGALPHNDRRTLAVFPSGTPPL